MSDDMGMAIVDGRDALAYVLIYPAAVGDGFAIDVGANGISKKQAAYVLRLVADAWDPPAVAGHPAGREAT